MTRLGRKNRTDDYRINVTRSKWIVNNETPIFTKNKEFLYNLIKTIG